MKSYSKCVHIWGGDSALYLYTFLLWREHLLDLFLGGGFVLLPHDFPYTSCVLCPYKEHPVSAAEVQSPICPISWLSRRQAGVGWNPRQHLPRSRRLLEALQGPRSFWPKLRCTDSTVTMVSVWVRDQAGAGREEWAVPSVRLSWEPPAPACLAPLGQGPGDTHTRSWACCPTTGCSAGR